MSETILEVKDLKKHYPVLKGIILLKQIGSVKAVDGVNFTIGKGETLGLVGESGCGKTTISRLILLLEKITSGSILYKHENISQLSGSRLKNYRNSIQAVFQDPSSSLSPRMRVSKIIAEPILENPHFSKREVEDRIAELVEMVGLTKQAVRLYPHEFSGGQKQRIGIARALAPNPNLIILDEPVSALDVSIRAQIMNLLHDIQQKFGISYLLIAHDLAVVRHMSHKVAIMYLGKIVETAGSTELYSHPLHPYTRALLSAALPFHPDDQKKEIILSGEVPSPLNPPLGCRFYPRCAETKPICTQEEPSLIKVGGGHEVACHLYKS